MKGGGVGGGGRGRTRRSRTIMNEDACVRFLCFNANIAGVVET